jgi:hypothetical protein
MYRSVWVFFFFVLLASCSHNKPAPESTTVAAQATPTPDPVEGILDPLDCPNGRCSTANTNEYLNTVVMPKILHSNVVHDCFLNKKRATQKELAHGQGSFHFEAKVVANGDHVNLEHIYLSRFTNIPLWSKACLVKEYQKMSFPPFQDKRVKSTSAFATVEISWAKEKVKKKIDTE